MESTKESRAESAKIKVSYKQEELRNPAPHQALISKIQKIYYNEQGKLKNITQKRVELKSIKTSDNCLNEGHKKFERKLYREAVDWYTKSMAFAPDGGNDLGSVQLGRCLTNLHENRLIDCLLDVNRALERTGLSGVTRQGLTKVKEECRDKMLASERYAIYQGNEIDPINATNADADEGDREFSDRCNFENPLIPRASSKIKLEYDAGKWGRHIVATEDIQPGEILSSRKFFATQLDPKLWFQYCSYCHAECRILIPCSSCSSEMYCTTRCQERAKELYHDMECKVFSYEIFFTSNRQSLAEITILKAQRTLLIGTKQGIELENLKKKLDMSKIFAENVDLRNEPIDDYLAVLRMNRTFNFDILTEDLIKLILYAVVALRQAGYFGARRKTKKDSLSEIELFTTMLLANHVLMLLFNNEFKITHFLGRSLYKASSERALGRGVVSLYSCINHSCDPNINSIIRRRKRVIFAVRTIKKGEQIFDSYCGIFTNHSLRDRESRLKKFGFVCQCDACLYNWPLADIADSEEETFLKGCEAGTIRPQPKLLYKPEHFFREILSILQLAMEFEIFLLKIGKKPQLYNTVQSKCKILQFLLKIRVWFDNNVDVRIQWRKPLMVVMECEKNITVFMKLLFEKSSGRCFHMEVDDVMERVQHFTQWLDNYIHYFFSLHVEEYSNINLSI